MKKAIDWRAGLMAVWLISILGFVGAMKEPVFELVDTVFAMVDPTLEQQ